VFFRRSLPFHILLYAAGPRFAVLPLSGPYSPLAFFILFLFIFLLLLFFFPGNLGHEFFPLVCLPAFLTSLPFFNHGPPAVLLLTFSCAVLHFFFFGYPLPPLALPL